MSVSLDCVVIGEEGTLAARCGDLLLEAGHRIVAVVSPSPAIRAWAAERALPLIEPGDDLAAALAATPCDVLFSIANWRVLAPAVLALPRLAAINYHDSPLPAYAGANATCWALIDGQAQHGVSWHVMEAGIDSGAILAAETVAVAATDTAATLNAKCYEAAVASFRRLLGDLAANALRPRLQGVEGRSSFARHAKPAGGAVLDWQQSASALERLVRACDFGGLRNPFAAAKVVAGGAVWLVRRAVALAGGAAAPGTLLAIEPGHVDVATAAGTLRLSQCEAVDGSAAPLHEVLRKLGVAEGGAWPGLDAAARERLDHFLARFARFEEGWARRLAEFEPLDLLPDARGGEGEGERFITVAAAVPAGWPAARGLAAIAVWLAQLAGRDTIDVMLAAEVPAGLDGVIAAEVPWHLDLPADGSGAQALARAEDTLGAALAQGSFFTDLPWRRPEWFGARPALPHAPLLLRLGGPVARANAVTCAVADGRVVWTIDSWRFDGAAAQSLARRAGDFLAALAVQPETAMSSLPLLPPELHHTMVRQWNDTASGHDAAWPLIRRFEAQAQAQPQADAVITDHARHSYAEIDAWANGVAARLVALGAGAEQPVLVLVERGAALPVALLAAHKAGAPYVPLDPGHPDARLAEVAADCGAVAVLSAGAQCARAARLAPGLPVVDCGAAAPQAAAPMVTVAPADAAYVLYTSGSTGTPKGVVIEQRQLAAYVDWAARTYPKRAGDCFALFTSIAFDLTVTSVFVPLITGGAIRVYPEERPGDEPTVLRVFRDDAVEVVKLTPSHLAMVAETATPSTRIHTLVLGGEDLSRGLADKAWRAFAGRVSLCNEYGPTETTVGCMLHRFDPETDRAASVPIGKPAADVALYVLDRHRRPLPPGVAGELYIGGAGVGRGYLGRAQLTAERFLADPFRPGGRLYRTGDLARWRGDGVMEFLGRMDGQIKLRGFRIELGEVESRLLSHPAIAACVVAAVDPAQGGAAAVEYCRTCGLPSNYPGADFDASGECAACRGFARHRPAMMRYFRPMDDLRARFAQAKGGGADALVLYSGGKDSTYALYQLVRGMGLKVVAFTFDNGFISAKAKENIRNAIDDLGIELVVGGTPAISAIYADSLERHATVCNGCFKAIYTQGINLARERGIGCIVTGLSRGQIGETRLAELFDQGITEPDAVEAAVLAARKLYHRQDDAVSRHLDVSFLQGDDAFDRIDVVDFYRYCDAGVAEIYDYIHRNVRWVKPDTGGCSTNCVINDAGIFVHQRRRGYHNYAWPNSWEVRLGLKARDEAIAELQSPIDEGEARRILDRIGYRWDERGGGDPRILAAYYRSRDGRAVEGLGQWLAGTLPAAMVPQAFVRLDHIPLTANGKVDMRRLPRPGGNAGRAGAGGVPATATERLLAELWRDMLRLDQVGRDDDFFALGGHSLTATRLLARLQDAFQLRLPLHLLMEMPRLGQLAAAIDRLVAARAAPVAGDDEDREEGEL
jgi:amino acid adenylation domain-containing protein